VTIGRHLPPATGRRLLRDAGPPNRWVLISFVAGVPFLAVAGAVGGPLRLLLIVAFLAILVIPSILDRDGWRIRIGMGWLAAEQRRRLKHLPRLPRTAAGADRWLARPEASGAGLVQASVLMIAGDLGEARRLVEAHPVTDVEDRARVERMLAALDGLERGRLDPAAANAAIAELPESVQPYHRLSLAWSTAWVDAANGRPWQRAFAEAATGFDGAGIPARYLGYAALQEFLAPLCGLAVVLAFLMIGWL
jgi:hypothetical protein